MTDKEIYNGDIMAVTLDLIERELRNVLPATVDAEYMAKASKEQMALVRIALILANGKREVMKK